MSRYYSFGPYREVLGVLKQIPKVEKGFTRERALRTLQLTPGLFFSPGTTWDDIFERMESWGWISKENSKLYLTNEALKAAILWPPK